MLELELIDGSKIELTLNFARLLKVKIIIKSYMKNI